jgi:hypothetical protein
VVQVLCGVGARCPYRCDHPACGGSQIVRLSETQLRKVCCVSPVNDPRIQEIEIVAVDDW